MKPDGKVDTAGKGALIQTELSATLGITQDQYLFVPEVRANELPKNNRLSYGE